MDTGLVVASLSRLGDSDVTDLVLRGVTHDVDGDVAHHVVQALVALVIHHLHLQSACCA